MLLLNLVQEMYLLNIKKIADGLEVSMCELFKDM